MLSNVYFFTQEFTIQCTVKDSNGSNVPFSIPSTITLNELYTLVASKSVYDKGSLRLRYRLESDKAKAGATSIGSNEELDIFTQRMRPLIVPQRLANGKISTRALKAIVVHFEDAMVAEENNKVAQHKGKVKKVYSS